MMPKIHSKKIVECAPTQLLNHLTQTLTDAQTLTQFALGANLESYEEATLGHYWLSIENLLHDAEKLCELFIEHFSPHKFQTVREVPS